MFKEWGNFFKNKYIKYSIYVILSCALLYFFYKYQIQWLDLTLNGDFGDETETILVTKLIAQGYKLYVDVYNNHGSLVFLPGILLSKYKTDAPIWMYRYIIIFLQDFALLSILTSPISNNFYRRYIATLFVGFIFVFYLPNFYGHSYIYQNIGGYLLFSIITGYVLPVLYGKKISKFRTIFFNVLLISIIFDASLASILYLIFLSYCG